MLGWLCVSQSCGDLGPGTRPHCLFPNKSVSLHLPWMPVEGGQTLMARTSRGF